MIPNIDKTTNIFVWGEATENIVEIPVGSYELSDLIESLTERILQNDED